MPTIHLTTVVKGKKKIVFDLARSIDMHVISTEGTDEIPIAGRMEGLIEKGEYVTWRAKHLGFYQTLTARITEMELYTYFTDEMEKGIFHSFRHTHYFEEKNGTTIMKDSFVYKAPLGLLGKLADVLFLKDYMEKFLSRRNMLIKKYAETELWKNILDPRNYIQ